VLFRSRSTELAQNSMTHCLSAGFPRSHVVANRDREAGIYGAANAGLADTQELLTYLNDDDCFGIHFAAMVKRHATAKILGPSAFDVFRTSIRRGAK
jgi:hypothetical protein